VGSLCVPAGTEQELGNSKHEKTYLQQSKQQQQCLKHATLSADWQVFKERLLI
jgi:hypothetical protein